MRTRLVSAAVAVASVAATLIAALAVEAAGRGAPVAEPALRALPKHLSQTGLYAPGSTTRVRTENVPFSPQYPLWSDGASKRRWIYVPPGASIDASQPDAFAFPPGTKFWKEFGHERRIETRLIERVADGTWRYATYVWNTEGTDAILASEDGIVLAGVAGAPGGRYEIPSRNDCLACHEGGTVPILGFSALQLSRDRDPLAPHTSTNRDGESDLDDFFARKTIRNLPASLLEQPPRIAASTPVERAALGYLHGNCAHCHNATGAVAGIDLVLAQSASDPLASAQHTIASLVGYSSRFRAHGSKATSRIVAGDVAQSVIAVRMRSDNAMTRMPPLGVTVVDDAGLALIERWIGQYLTLKTETTP